MKKNNTSLVIDVLAPHDKRSHTKNFTKHEYYNEYRFHYAWPYSIEKLAGRGILPALQANPLNYLLIPLLFAGEFLALLRLARHTKPDIIYAHWFTPQAINARIVSTLRSVPFVFTTHASDVSIWNKIPLLGRWIVQSNVRKARAFTAVSRRSMQKLASFFNEPEWQDLKKRSAIIPMGVDIPINDTTHTSPTKEASILFMGRLAEKKGVQYLLPAFAKILVTFPTATLTIAGDGPWLDRLKRLTTELNIPPTAINFPGYVTGPAKEDLLKSHRVYVVPSIITKSGDAEGLPVSLMEGLAHGKICIATNESGADDIISEGKDGYLVPEKNSESILEALHKALSLTQKEQQNISKAAIATSHQFSWPHVAKQHISFLFKR